MVAYQGIQPTALSAMFSDVETFAGSQAYTFTGTAGTVLKRKNASGFEFYSYQFYDALGAKRERYVAGPVGDPNAERQAEEMRSRISDVNRITQSIRLLGREGFQLVDARTFATLAALHNNAIFTAGGLLVGSHAYGVIVNRLGIRAPAYATEDIDIARGTPLQFASRKNVRFLEALRESGIDFIELPSLDPRASATSFKERGRSTFKIELLSPARGEDIGQAPLPELHADAVTLPYLGYLIKESQMSAAIAREGCCAVRVPLPERFAVHKLVVSSLRRGRDAKVSKDRMQAAAICAALGDFHPGALAAAVRDLPRRAFKHFRQSLLQIRPVLETAHARAWDELVSTGAK